MGAKSSRQRYDLDFWLTGKCVTVVRVYPAYYGWSPAKDFNWSRTINHTIVHIKVARSRDGTKSNTATASGTCCFYNINPLRANYCHTWHMENHPFLWRRIRRVRRIQVCMARKGLRCLPVNCVLVQILTADLHHQIKNRDHGFLLFFLIYVCSQVDGVWPSSLKTLRRRRYLQTWCFFRLARFQSFLLNWKSLKGKC